MRTHWVATLISAGTLLSALACSNDHGTGPNTGPNSFMRVEAISRTNLEGTVGETVSRPAVRVTDGDEKPLPNVTVEFLVSEGSVETPAAATDTAGIARAGAWVLSTRAGPNILSVRVAGVERFQFVATGHVGIPTTLRAIWPTNEQAGLVGEAVRAPEVQVQDQYGHPIASAVTFAIGEGGGIVNGATAIAGAYGEAQVASWVLGRTPGRNSLTASAPGMASVKFVAQALDPATLTWFSLDGIRSGDKLQSPSDFNVSGAKLALANLDPCLCRQQADYFVEDIEWTSWSGRLDHNSGRYQTEDAGSPWLLITAETAHFEGNTLLIQRYDVESAFPLTWVYKKANAAP